MEQQFSVGEWVIRRMDNQIGQVKKVQPFNDDIAYYIQFDPRDPNDLWAGTTSAWKRLPLHAHVETESRDCDGKYTGGRVEEMTLEDRCDSFHDLHFKERVLGNIVSLHGTGTLAVTPIGFRWNEQTEEGYSFAEVTWCEDDCDDKRTWQRDHSAEAAGY